MKTALALVVALLSALFLALVAKRRLAGNQPQRQSDPVTIAVVIIVFLLSGTAALARPSQYPGVTPFVGDRYGSAQLGADVANAARCPPPCARGRAGKARHLYPTRKRPPASRQKWRQGPVPFPAPRPLAEPGTVGPLSVAGGAWREARRAVGRPAAWCGWWLGHHLGRPRRDLWLARNWAGEGSNAGGPGIGVVVVWRHHVGIITGRQGNQWVVKSGNDGRRVRERARSVAGAIAFRRVS